MTQRKQVSPEALDASLLPKQRKPIPHAFVLDAISTLSPYTRPMFGCLAIYVKDKIVLILRDKPKSTADNGVWLRGLIYRLLRKLRGPAFLGQKGPNGAARVLGRESKRVIG